MPITYAVMWIGSLALAGIPLFAGYYSKDTIIEAAFGAHSGVGQYAFWLGVAAAFMTALYSWRLIIMTFHGKPRATEEVMHHVHESPWIMLVPLILLAVGAVFAGALGFETFVGEHFRDFWHDSILVLPAHGALEAAHHVPVWVSILTLVVAFGGIGAAYFAYMYRTELPGWLAARFQGVYLFLLNKWYFDELYDRLLVEPAKVLGRGLWKGGDGALIDGVGPDGVAAATQDLARRASALQSGYVYHYAFAILIGVAVFVSLYIFTIVR
jgi:NADH-quinone oxidoreductase subunit L